MLSRLHFIFIKRFTEVKPVSLAADTQWLSQMSNTLEAFADDTKRYGIGVAVYNFVVLVRFLNRRYSARQRE